MPGLPHDASMPQQRQLTRIDVHHHHAPPGFVGAYGFSTAELHAIGRDNALRLLSHLAR